MVQAYLGSIPATSNCLLSCGVEGGMQELVPVMIKLHDTTSPNRKNQVFEEPSMGKRSVSARYGNKITLAI